jgi:hypothetical protein
MMSRHTFEHDGARWIVGWDEATVTYFAQREAADRELTDVAGTSLGQHTTVASLLEQLHDTVEVPDELRAQLEREAPAFTAAAVQQPRLRVDELAADLQHAARTPLPAAGVER